MTTFLTCLLQLSPFWVFLLTGSVNKSNVVTASTSIQLLDERKSPVVAGKQWISINDYKVSIHLPGQSTTSGYQEVGFERKTNLITPSSARCHLQPKALTAGCGRCENRNLFQDFILKLWACQNSLVRAEEYFLTVGSVLIQTKRHISHLHLSRMTAGKQGKCGFTLGSSGWNTPFSSKLFITLIPLRN